MYAYVCIQCFALLSVCGCVDRFMSCRLKLWFQVRVMICVCVGLCMHTYAYSVLMGCRCVGVFTSACHVDQSYDSKCEWIFLFLEVVYFSWMVLGFMSVFSVCVEFWFHVRSHPHPPTPPKHTHQPTHTHPFTRSLSSPHVSALSLSHTRPTHTHPHRPNPPTSPPTYTLSLALSPAHK